MLLLDATNFINPKKQLDKKIKAKDESEQLICCAVCHSQISSIKDLCEIEGDVQHSKINPAGLRYTFYCFALAPGCKEEGGPVSEHTWFTGCLWQFASCRNCGNQLGWFFTGRHSFFGLIQERIIECDNLH